MPNTGGGGGVPSSLAVVENPPPDHVRLKNELLYLAQKQRSRIDRLRSEADVQVARFAAAKRKDLLQQRDALRREIKAASPDATEARRTWQAYKVKDTEQEALFSKLSEEYISLSSMVKVLQDAIAGAYQGTGEGKQTARSTRERLDEVQKDKVELHRKIKRAIDCVVVDQNMLSQRLSEEQVYSGQLRELLKDVELETAGANEGTDQKETLQEQVRVVEERLTEMKQVTNALHDRYQEVKARKKDMVEEFLMESGRTHEDLVKSQSLLSMKKRALQELQNRVAFLSQSVQPVTKENAPSQEAWLAQNLEVVEQMLQDVGPSRAEHAVKPEDTLLLREITSHCSKAKAELAAIEYRVEGHDKYRGKLVEELCDMRYLMDEKLKKEDILQEQMDALLARLGEDAGHVREIMDRAGYDDYVSSDSEVSDEGDLLVLDEEGTADVDAITTSLDYAVDDPAGADAVQRFGHRQQGPLPGFVEARSAALARRRRQQPTIKERLRPKRKEATPEVALAVTQEQAVNVVVAALVGRRNAIQGGAYSPDMDAVAPDPNYATRVAEVKRLVNEWKDQQTGGGGRYAQSAAAAASGAAGGHPAELPGAIPTDAALSLGSRDEIAVQYLQIMAGGFNAMMFFGGPTTGPMGPNPRQFFMTKDLRRIAWRPLKRDGQAFDDESISVADVPNKGVVRGQNSAVFKQHREAKKLTLRPHCALSIVTTQNTTVDVEFETEQERDYWHQILDTVITELKPGGTVAAVVNSGVVMVCIFFLFFFGFFSSLLSWRATHTLQQVSDYSPPNQRSTSDEPYERSHVKVSLKTQ